MVTLYVKDGRKFSKAAPEVIIGAAREIAIEAVRQSGISFDRPHLAREFFITQFAGLEHEEFCVAFLDGRLRLRAFERMFRGTIDNTPMYAREVVKAVLKHNSTSIVIAHNHPSGVAKPSDADVQATQALAIVLAVIEVRILDHFIVAGTSVYSMVADGQL